MPDNYTAFLEKVFNSEKEVINGNTYACVDLGHYWIDTQFTATDREALYQRLLLQAEQNNANCIYFIGQIKEDALSIEEAVSWYKRAAALKHEDALYRLGLYSQYTGQAEQAFEYFYQAAELGSTKAAYSLACCFAEGIGTIQDAAKAFLYYNQAYVDDLGLCRLACCYEKGIGTSKNLSEAAACYYDALTADLSPVLSPLGCFPELEDETGNAYEGAAHLGLGRCLLKLHAHQKRSWYGCASEHFKAAYDQGEAEAAYYLGLSYLFGTEIKTDIEKGFSYMEEAADSGIAEARLFLEHKQSQEQRLTAIIKAGRASAETRKEEACLRLAILEQKGLDPDARKNYDTTGIPGIGSDDTCGVVPFTPEQTANYKEIHKIIDTFEASGNTVYYIHVSLTFAGTMVSLFFVSDQPSEWLNDRRDLLKEHPITAVANLKDDYVEIGTIRFTIEGQSMERLG